MTKEFRPQVFGQNLYLRYLYGTEGKSNSSEELTQFFQKLSKYGVNLSYYLTKKVRTPYHHFWDFILSLEKILGWKNEFEKIAYIPIDFCTPEYGR